MDEQVSNTDIADRFWQNVEHLPENIALESNNIAFSYQQLGSMVSQIVGAINQLDLTNAPSIDGQFVAILADHSHELVISILATAMAGKAYVPLDPNFPAERLQKILTGLKPAIIITDEKNQLLAETIKSAKSILLCANTLINDHSFSRPPSKSVCANRAVYALSTSGTTGEPKLIVHRRESLVRAVDLYRADLNINSNDKVGLILPCVYTPASFCIFGALLSGATLSLLDVKLKQISTLIDWLEKFNISLLYGTPSIFRNLINDCNDVTKLQSLRDIHLVGEPLYKSDVELSRNKLGSHFTIHNGFGASETSCLTRFRIDEDTVINTTQVPVGRPYNDVDITLVNSDQLEVDVGEVGEIVVGGQFIAHGYWGQPSLSLEKFKIDESTGEVLYRTGDRGMWLDDGNLLYLGRNDSQVKINGQRVELPEIESVLLLHPEVDDAVVLYITDQQPAFLAAFVTPDASVSDLRKFLSNRLPPFMIPTRIVGMASFPVGGSGKVDRKALSKHCFVEAKNQQSGTVIPDSMFELRVLNCFRRVLKNEQLDAAADFFMAGGDSFKAIELAIELEREVAVPVNISALIEAPTAKLLAKEIERSIYQDNSRVVVNLHNKQSVGDEQAAPTRALLCLPGLFGDAFSFRAIVNCFRDDLPIYALEYPGLASMGVSIDSLDDIIQVCANAFQEVFPKGDIVLVCYSLGGVIGFELARKLQQLGRHVEAIVLLDCYTPDGIKRRHVYKSLSQPFNTIKDRFYKKKSDFDVVFSRHAQLNQILTAAVYNYQPSPQNLAKTLLIKTENERFFWDDYKQWWKIIEGEISVEKIDCDHLGIILEENAQLVSDIIAEFIPDLRKNNKKQFARSGLNELLDVLEFNRLSPVEISSVDESLIPSLFLSLLNSTDQLTSRLQTAAQETIYVDIKTSQQKGRHYYRKVALVGNRSKAVLAVAAIKISMNYFAPQVVDKILSAQTPFGRILCEHEIAYTCRLLKLCEVGCNPELNREFNLPNNHRNHYGRVNQFIDDQENILAEVLEVLSPVLEPAVSIS